MKMAELKILSYNAQGIGGISKRTVLEVYKKRLYQLFKILKDIALTNNELKEFNKDWEPYERLLNN